MTMNTKVFMLGMVMAASMVQAEVLSWRVDIPSGNSTYQTAQLFATTTSENYWTTGSAQGSAAAPYSSSFGVLTQDTNLSVGNSYSFYVKLFTDSGSTVVGWSGLMTWDQLVTAGALVAGTTPTFPATTPWNAGTSVVPEPTSMGLLALGMSALLLRRRRRS
jgi:PEP-CTERM motif